MALFTSNSSATMNSLPILLFVYGTLHPELAPPEIADVARTLKFVSPGTVRGRLHDLGEYPGLVLDDSPCAPLVAGDIFAVPDGKTLAALDAYEGFPPGSPGASEFERTHIAVTLTDGSEGTCWVYVYNTGVEAR